jgi:hypothetical protein
MVSPDVGERLSSSGGSIGSTKGCRVEVVHVVLAAEIRVGPRAVVLDDDAVRGQREVVVGAAEGLPSYPAVVAEVPVGLPSAGGGLGARPESAVDIAYRQVAIGYQDVLPHPGRVAVGEGVAGEFSFVSPVVSHGPRSGDVALGRGSVR